MELQHCAVRDARRYGVLPQYGGLLGVLGPSTGSLRQAQGRREMKETFDPDPDPDIVCSRTLSPEPYSCWYCRR